MSNKPSSSGEQWGSRIGVILAVAGSAVGLGNFLRFPGKAADHGGGAFMIPYFVSLLLLGIPLGFAEWSMGRYGGRRGFNSAPGIFRTLWNNRAASFLGTLGLLVPLMIYMYYVQIEAWCLLYSWDYLSGNMDTLSRAVSEKSQTFGDHFQSATGQTADGSMWTGHSSMLWCIILVFALNFWCIYRGVSKGIETLCKFAMPTMFLCAICVLIRVLTLPPVTDPDGTTRTVLSGLNYMWNPDFNRLWESKTWLAAAGQIFFSLSVGFGVIINYASYLKKKDDLALSSLTASSVNELFEVCFGGMITIPAAVLFLGVAATKLGTFGMGFVALPDVFELMPAGRFFGFLWYFMLFLAAITSSVSMLQPVIAFLEEGLGLKRHASAALLGLITTLGAGFILHFSRNLAALDTIDFWTGELAIVVLALVQSVIYGWVWGTHRGDQELHSGAHIRIPKLLQFVLKYVTPLFLLAMLASFLIDEAGLRKRINDIISNADPDSQTPVRLSFGLIIIVTIFLLLLTKIAVSRWESQGRFKRLAADGSIKEIED